MRGAAAALALTLLIAGAAAAQDAGGASGPAAPVGGPQPGANAATGGSPASREGASAAVSPQPDLQSAVLTIDQDALYAGSRWGQRMRATLEARSRAVQAENDRIAAALEAEDDALTALRPTLDPDEFRRRADAFDAKV